MSHLGNPGGEDEKAGDKPGGSHHPPPRYAHLDAGAGPVDARAAKGCENPNFKGSYLGRFPLALADFWTSDHLSERSRSMNFVF